jgi:hypothetical protein
MKTTLKLITVFALAIGGLNLNSCSALTKSDAQQIGREIAAASLLVATRSLAGEKVDLKQEAAIIGLQAAGTAITLASRHLAPEAAPAAVPPPAVINGASVVSQDLIAEVADAEPAKAALAKEIATHAAAVAKAEVTGADAGR